MSKSTYIKNALFILVFIAFIAAAVFGYRALAGRSAGSSEKSSSAITDNQNENAGITQLHETAADFTVTDQTGSTVRLADYIGKPIVLNFWASWCGSCQIEMYDFENMYAEYGDSVQFMMINATDGTTETVQTADDYIADHNLTFPVFYDTEGSALKAYGIYAFPQTFFINDQGEVVAHIVGMATESSIKEGIEMILK